MFIGMPNRSESSSAKLNLRNRVFQSLEQDILSGKYPSGTNLTEKDLCEEFGVSRTPLREALCQLELEGLVECIPNKGAVVLGISEQDVNDIYTIKLTLDGLAARLRAFFEMLDSWRLRAGAVGLGELVRAVLGIDKLDGGEIWLNGKKTTISSFRDAIRKGFALVPEDRKLQGLVQLLTVERNICLVNLDVVAAGAVVSSARERKHALEYIGKLSIATPSPDTEVQYLSGGNQQKVVIAKWLLQDADIIILDEPTRGIDVGAKKEIYQLINQLKARGKAILMISSEMPEILGVSDRIMVLADGRKKGELSHDEATQEKIMTLATMRS